MNVLNDSELRDIVFFYFKRTFRRLNDAAKKYNCSVSFISAVATGKKTPTKAMMKDIGIKKITVYVDDREKTKKESH